MRDRRLGLGHEETYFEVGVVLGIPVGIWRDAVGEVLPGGERVEALSGLG